MFTSLIKSLAINLIFRDIYLKSRYFHFFFAIILPNLGVDWSMLVFGVKSIYETGQCTNPEYISTYIDEINNLLIYNH